MTGQEHDQLSDVEQIRRLIGRYCRALDERRYADVATHFAANAFADYAGTRLTGQREIVQFVSGLAVTYRTQHLLQLQEIEFSEKGAKSVTSGTATLVSRPQDGMTWVTVRGLTYADEWVLDEGGWRINERRQAAVWSYRVRGLANPGALWGSDGSDLGRL